MSAKTNRTLRYVCTCIWKVRLTMCSKDQKAKYNYDIIDAVHKNFYMDDYLGSYRNMDLAKETVANVTKLLSEGGFRLTKWISNSNSLLEVLPQSEITKSSTEGNSMKNETEKILGMMWNYKRDTINVKHSNKSYLNTKRGILSHISFIFVPLGLLVTFLLEPKLIIQQLWKEKIKWDNKIPETLIIDNMETTMGATRCY